MNRMLLSFLIAFCCKVSWAQTIQEVHILFSAKKYEQALAGAQALLAKDNTNAYAYAYATMGTVYNIESKFDSSVYYSTRAIILDNDSTIISGWAHANLGYAYICLGKRQVGVEELNRTLTLGLSSVKFAKRTLDSIGYDVPVKKYAKDYAPDWVTIDRPGITYNFQDTVGITSSVYKYIQEREEAFTKLDKIFEAKTPRKMLFYVWNDKKIAEKIVRRKLCFTFYKQCFSHEYRYMSPGHEMTHTLSYWAWGTQRLSYSKFINEGIAECFDQCKWCDKYAIARAVFVKKGVNDVMDIWKKEKKYKDKVIYPVGAAFVTYLYEKSSQEEFRSLVKNQAIDSVEKTYGPKFYTLVKEFNGLMGLKQ